MTALPAETRRELRAALRANAGKWIARFYRHELLTARTVVGMQIEAQQEFDRTVVRPLLREIGGRLATFDPRGQDVVAATYPELADLEREIQRIVDRGSDAVRRLSAERLDALTRHESDWVADSARKVLGVEPVQPTLAEEQEAASRPVLGTKVEDWFSKTLAGDTGDKVRAWVATGIQRGLTTDEIVRGLRGTKSEAGILDAPRHTVAAIVRTAATHVSAQARMTSFAGIGVTRWRFVATLDHRTCFASGTMVRLANGEQVPIQSVTVGDVVESGSGAARRVSAVMRSTATDWREIRFASGDRVRCTWNHPLWTRRGWVDAQHIAPGEGVGVRPMRGSFHHGSLASEAPVLQPTLLRTGQTNGDDFPLRPLQRGSETASEPAKDILLQSVLLRGTGSRLHQPSVRQLRTSFQRAPDIRRSESRVGNTLLGCLPIRGETRWRTSVCNDILLRDMPACLPQKSVESRAVSMVLESVPEEAGDQGVRDVQGGVSGPCDVATAFLRDGVLQAVESGNATGSHGEGGDRTYRVGLQARGQGWEDGDRLRDPSPVVGDRGRRNLLASEHEGSRRPEGPGGCLDGASVIPHHVGRGHERGKACGCEGTLPAPVRFDVVESVNRLDGDSECFDIEVEGDHCFLIESGLIVHNSIQCAAHDGKTFTLGEGPVPPLHPNCRSTPVPDFGDPIGTRAATGGQVDATTTFPEWLRGQPASEQDRVLGSTRAAAWRAGDLTIEQMLGRDLQPLTLRELRAMDRIE